MMMSQLGGGENMAWIKSSATRHLCTHLPICKMGPVLTSHIHCEGKVLTPIDLTEPADTHHQADMSGLIRVIQRAVHPPQHLLSEVMVTRWGEIPGATRPSLQPN